MKIGILLPNWIGDVVMATPTLRAIRNRFGSGAEIAGIMRPYVSEVLTGTNWLDRQFFFDRGRTTDPALGTGALIRGLRAWQPDTMVLLPNSFWGAALAWLSRAHQRVGYARNGRGFLLTTRLHPIREGRRIKPISTIEYYLRLAHELGCEPESARLELGTRPEDEARADGIWRDLQLDRARRVVVFNTGSAVGTARNWPVEYYVDLARRVVSQPGHAVLVICGPYERHAAVAIEQAAHHPRVKSMANHDLSLGLAKACVRRATVLVTTDSGPRHFAPAFDVPSITLSGPIDPRWSESNHARALTLQHPVDCGPCGKTECPFAHHHCMRGLTVDKVFAAVRRVLRAAEAGRGTGGSTTGRDAA